MLQAEFSEGCIHFSASYHLNKAYSTELFLSHEYLGVKNLNTLASSDLLLLIAGRAHVYTLLRQLTLHPLSLLIHTFPFKLLAFFPICRFLASRADLFHWRKEQGVGPVLMQEFAEELHTAFLCKLLTQRIHPFLKVCFGNNVLKSCLDLKSFKCRGCKQYPEIWNGTRCCSVQWPGIKATWLRGASRGQVVCALPCSKLSSS